MDAYLLAKKEPDVSVQNGKICTQGGCVIENPALIIYTGIGGGVLMSWGDRSVIEAKYKDMVAKYHALGCTTDGLLLITLDNAKMSRVEQCYILRRCIDYTASGFHTKLCDMLNSDGDFLSWLRLEMQSVPINVEG